MNNEILLRNWLAKTLVDNPDLINKNTNPVMIYAQLQEIWLREVQIAFKNLIKDFDK